MTSISAAHAHGFAATQRLDRWWIQPLFTVLALSAFVVYSTWAAFQGVHYSFGPYLSPFYSPELFHPAGLEHAPHAWFGELPAAWPSWLPYSPALLILWAPGGFRFTCYYYRKAYYRSFVRHPAACAVSESGSHAYKGETRLLLIQNLHRFFMYLALAFLIFLWHDVWKALWFDDDNGGTQFGIGAGTLVLLINTTFLTGYVLSCHSFRHLVGGGLSCFSECPMGRTRHSAWKSVTALNAHHQGWAWLSLFGVGFADAYVRLCSMGIWTDMRLL